MTTSVVDRVVWVYDQPSILTLYAGKLDLDIDPLSERHIVMDRNTGRVFYTGKNDINTHYLDPKYAINSDIVVTIFDDDGTYNAAVADGVKCEVLDLIAT